MTDTITETMADIEALAARVSWELMDEDQRDELMEQIVMPRWGKTTADGVVLKGTAWAKLLGTNANTIETRHRRLRARDQDEHASATEPAPNQRASIRSARAAIRAYPELAADLVQDPEVSEAVDDALIAKRADEIQRTPTPDPAREGRTAERHVAEQLGQDPVVERLRDGYEADVEALAHFNDAGTTDEDGMHDYIERQRRILDALEGNDTVLTDEDRDFLDTIGVK